MVMSDVRRVERKNAVRENEETLDSVRPAVDAAETAEGVELFVDLPGVDEKSVQVTVDNGTLTIEARRAAPVRDHGTVIGEEFGGTLYRRAFDVSDRFNPAAIRAHFKHGVLKVTLPKREEVKARTIEISAG